jgi:membrane-bound lytic murein transglycosylase B
MALLATAIMAAGPTGAYAAGPTTTTTSTTTTSTTVAPPPITDVDSAFVAAVRAEVGSAEQSYELAMSTQRAAEQVASAEAATVADATDRLAALTMDQQRQATKLAVARGQVRDFALVAYMTGGVGVPMSALLDAPSIADLSQRRAYIADVVQEAQAEQATYDQLRRNTPAATLHLADSLHAAQGREALANRVATAAAAAVQRAAALVESRQQLLTLAADAFPADGTDIPRLVLDAYQRAALGVQARGCRLTWWGLAGIGRIESHHGTGQGGALEANGDIVPPILGPALDGTNGTQATPAVDAGRRTGDPKWDHAVGPMQFIGSTWAKWGVDGNGDGVANPNNVYDASLSTAHYLCTAAADLDTPAGLRAAYFSYNHSDAYVTDALAAAASYEAADAAGTVPALSPVPLYSSAP